MNKVSAADVVGRVAKVSGAIASGAEGKIVLMMPTGPVTLIAKSNSSSSLTGGTQIRVIGSEKDVAIVEEIVVKAPHVPLVPEWDALEASMAHLESTIKE